MRYVADNSDMVEIQTYGYTNQDRPLVQLTISTKENIDKIDQIQKDHLKSLTGNVGSDPYAIVWLSFGVHGNEAGASESSLNVLYQLVSGRSEVNKWLENTIVIIDPSINPDGFDRYTHWVRNVSTKEVQPEPYSREHNEPWPGGRVNHYLFDLNRDWAWATQVETQQRLKIYNEWMPHIHADYHEQGHNDHYYFAPAARPYHKSITDWQAEFQVEIGRNNAKYFDDEGWLYFTREVFDLFYPSYGDTYPTFNGAVGMTYEQAGHSRAGRAIIMDNRDTLTLRDRIDHHTTTALSTIEVSSKNAKALANGINEFFAENKHGQFKSFVISRQNGENHNGLRSLLELHGIEYGQLANDLSQSGFNYRTGKSANCKLQKGDLVINTNQLKSVLITTLFDPEPELEDSLTYDITAWSLPLAYGLDAYAFDRNINSTTFELYDDKTTPRKEGTAIVIPVSSFESMSVVGDLMQKGIVLRYNSQKAQYGDVSVPVGSVIATKADNRKNKDWVNSIKSICDHHKTNFYHVHSGFASAGSDLGSYRNGVMNNPKVGTLSGSDFNPNSFGQLWNYFENVLHYPLIIVNADDLGSQALDDLDVLIIEEGGYSPSESGWKEIDSWIKRGGKLIAIGYATNYFENKDGFGFSKSESDREEEKAEPSDLAAQERSWISGSMPGAIMKANLDQAHPYCYGLGNTYHTLRTRSKGVPLQKDLNNIIYIPEDYTSYGFIGSKVKSSHENSLVLGEMRKGRGSVVYLYDNPLYRGFWKAGERLLFNVIFY